MQVVIKIDEARFRDIQRIAEVQLNRRTDTVEQLIAKGTPLPKGHGRLIDASKLKAELECGIRAGNYEEGYEKYPHINSMDDCIDAVEYADTIIEADKAESEDKE